MNDSEAGQSTTGRRASAGRAADIACDIIHKFSAWESLGPLDGIVQAAVSEAALLAKADAGEIAVVLSSDEEVRALNARFRGVDAPTNVLSFPQGKGGISPAGAARGSAGGPVIPRNWGDVILAYETVLREAQEQGKPAVHHLCHLVIHGALHLFGYSHDTAQAAERMEALEAEALARLGIPNPYADEPSPHEAILD